MERFYNLTQAYSQVPWRKQMQFMGLFLLGVIVAAVIAGLYLNVTARAAKVGREIQVMQAQVEELKRHNIDLQSQLAFVTSATEMEKRAHGLGFRRVGMDEALYIAVDGYRGRQPVTLGSLPQPMAVEVDLLPEEYTESVFVWLNRQMLTSAFPFSLLKVAP